MDDFDNIISKFDNINELLQYIRKNNIKFMFKKKYIKKDKFTLFKNLQNYKYNINYNTQYNIFNSRYFTKNIIKPLFKEVPTTFLFDESEYFNINILSDYYSEKCRIHCYRYDTTISPYDFFHDDTKMLTLFEYMQKRHIIFTWENIRETMYKLLPECSNFKLTLAHAVYKYFHATKILDISSGWGDRLLGAISIENNIDYYRGYDPNMCLKKVYLKIIKDLAKDKHKFKIKSTPFEKAKLKKQFDVIFTSPPYFDLETYTNKDDKNLQSIEQCPTLDKWLENMLFVWLKKAWDNLVLNGHMIINIENKINKKTGEKVLLVEEMVLYVNKHLEYANFLGVISFTNSKNGISEDNIYRPLFVWKKEK